MPDIRSSGIFADRKSAGGLYRGSYIDNVKIPGIPIEYVSSQEMAVSHIDFLTNTDFSLGNVWDLADIGTQTQTDDLIPVVGVPGGAARLTSDQTDGDGLSIALAKPNSLGNSLIPSADNVCTFKARVRASDWSGALIHWYVGILEVAVGDPVLDTNGDFTNTNATQIAGFHFNADDDVPGIPRLVYAGDNNTPITVTPDRPIAACVDDEFRTLGIRIEGTDKIEFYVDDVLVGGDVLASPFSDALAVTWCYVLNNNAGGTFDMDYFTTSQRR